MDTFRMTGKFNKKMEEHKVFVENIQSDFEEELKRRNREKSNFVIER